jgi:hypothetical protein
MSKKLLKIMPKICMTKNESKFFEQYAEYQKMIYLWYKGKKCQKNSGAF